MIERKTPYSASNYDVGIKKVLPYYEEFHKQVVDVVLATFDQPVSWLDIGCGTGRMAQVANEKVKWDRFVMSDMSADMLKIAESKNGRDKFEYLHASANEISEENAFDVVTAVQSLHYLHAEERRDAIRSYYQALKPNGLFISFENFAASSPRGLQLYMRRWEKFQVDMGRADERIQEHLNRYNNEYFPLTVEEHLKTIRECGFAGAEVLWVSNMQAGFVGIKEG